MENEYKVYVSLLDGYITSINSEIFLSEEEMLTMKEIDKGQGDKYAHAQSQYLEKGLVDEKFFCQVIPNYNNNMNNNMKEEKLYRIKRIEYNGSFYDTNCAVKSRAKGGEIV